MMSVPLLVEERALGVLQVLDRPAESKLKLAEVDLLGLFANEAAIALDLLQGARNARAVLDEEGGEATALARLSERLAQADPEKREAAERLIKAIDELLS